MSSPYTERIPQVAIAAFILVIPFITDSLYILNICVMSGIAVILGLTNHLILRTGAWFMGHIAFLAIGTYSVLLSVKYVGLNYWLALPLGGAMTGLVALGIGYATSKAKGIPFAIISVAFVEVVRLTIKGISAGRPVICPRPDAFFGIDFSSRFHYYYFLCALVAITVTITRLIDRSHIGRALIMISENESLAESVGLNTVRYKVMIMTFCCALAGVAGGFFAAYIKVIGDTSFNLMASIMILVFIIVGGAGSFWGPVIGAIFMTILPEFMPGQAAIQAIIYAAIVLVVMFVLPKGLVSLPGVIKERRASRRENVLR